MDYRLYKNNRMYVTTDNLQSQDFPVNEGIRQGGLLSPMLFNLVMDDVIKEAKTTSKLFVRYRKLEPV